MRYFFWNTHGEKINTYLCDKIVEKKYDIIILAEYKDDLGELLDCFDEKNIKMYNMPTPGCERITFLSNVKCKTGYSEEYFTIKIIKLSEKDIKIIGAVHLPSKMYAEDQDRKAILDILVRNIEDLEIKYNTQNSILVGDFNANPFEDCMINATGVHSVAIRDIAEKNKRKIKGKYYNMFYNPMWNKFGDFKEPAGTYFYRKSSISEYFWNIFDQVIIRPKLISKFKNSELSIVTDLSGYQLIKNGKITLGDHLPIEFVIEEE